MAHCTFIRNIRRNASALYRSVPDGCKSLRMTFAGPAARKIGLAHLGLALLSSRNPPKLKKGFDSSSLPERPHGAKTYSQKLDVCDGDMGPWRVPAGVIQNVPASQRRPPVSTVPLRTHHILVGRMCVNGNNGAAGEACSMD